MKRTRQISWSKVALILILTYFSQVYPYIHVHHSEGECTLPVEDSVRLADASPASPASHDSHSDHHHNVHHHHKFDQRVDYWPRIRSYSRSVSAPVDLFGICDGVIEDTDPDPRRSTGIFQAGSLFESYLEQSIVSRGPPILT